MKPKKTPKAKAPAAPRKKAAPKSAEPKVKAPRKKRGAKDPKLCVAAGCLEEHTTHGYCRACYIKNWRTIQFDKKIKAERRLNAYIDRLTKKYPKDFMEVIKQGLEDEGVFKKTVEELNVSDEQPETDTEFLEKFMRGIKGIE